MLSPDIGVSEMMIVAAVALIVVGPKDLPMLMRRVGQFIARLRGMASEFRASFEDMARQSELEDLRKEVEAIGIHTSHAWAPSGPNDLVDHAHEAGLLVHVYTFRNEPDKLGHAADGDPRLELRRFYELGVDGVFADYPDTAVEVRKALP